MSNKTTLQIDGKEIDLNQFLTKISAKPGYIATDEPNFKTELQIEDYSDLGFTISSLIGVCQVAIKQFAENEDLTEFEKEKHLGASSLSIIKVLDIAKNLIPFAEFELLTKLKH
jgi:hypothetical protein